MPNTELLALLDPGVTDFDVRVATTEALIRLREVFFPAKARLDLRKAINKDTATILLGQMPRWVRLEVQISKQTALPHLARVALVERTQERIQDNYVAYPHLQEPLAGWTDLDGWISHIYGQLFENSLPLGPRGYTDADGNFWECTLMVDNRLPPTGLNHLFSEIRFTWHQTVGPLRRSQTFHTIAAPRRMPGGEWCGWRWAYPNPKGLVDVGGLEINTTSGFTDTWQSAMHESCAGG